MRAKRNMHTQEQQADILRRQKQHCIQYASTVECAYSMYVFVCVLGLVGRLHTYFFRRLFFAVPKMSRAARLQHTREIVKM